MLNRKFAGITVGLLLSVLVAGTAFAAGQIGPNTVTPMNRGYNSPIWAQHLNGNSTLSQRWCNAGLAGESNQLWDYMHHWPAFPSTGTKQQGVWCANNATWFSKVWAVQNNVDYSAEFRDLHLNTNTYKIVYPTP